MITIYKILCNKKKSVYIGQTSNYSERKYQHLSTLRNNIHYNKRLQEIWDTYGEGDFEFKKLETGVVSNKDAITRETFWHNVFLKNPDFEVLNLVVPDKHTNEILITNEMIFDAKNQISKKDWVEKYNCSTHILKKIRKEHNVPKVPNNKPIETTEEMVQDIKNGITQKEWVKKYPYSIGVLKRVKKELGLSGEIEFSEEFLKDIKSGMRTKEIKTKYKIGQEKVTIARKQLGLTKR